jgi:capsular exopolysaccharide synthesis family protein
MSHIFDALQRSEAEANGAEMPETRKSTLPHATELLQLAERKMRAQNAASATRRERDQADRAQPDRIGADRAKVDHEDPDRAEMDGAALDRFADLPEFDREPSDVAATRRREGDLRESMRREPEVREPEVREPEGRETDRRDLGRRELGRPELDRRELERPSIALEQFPSIPVSIAPSSRLVSVGAEESLGAEKFRFLAVRLRQMRQSRPLKKILITSTIPQEGKSTVAANLACTLARRKQHKTLLLEGDLRRPTAADKFGLGRLTGLCDWLSGQVPNINLYRLESLGFWILPAGSAPENPLELMQSGKMANLMLQLEDWFDWILIDSPPVLPLADASIWSRMADGILLVTRRGVTEKKQLQRGLEAIERSKLLGALVNSSSNAAHSDYYQRYTTEGDRPK